MDISVSKNWRESHQCRSLTPFTRAVYELCCNIPRGRVSTYGALGAALGAGTGAAQAVGNALHSNPFAPIVPCHRVIRGGQNPSLGGFMGVKESLSLSKELSKKIALLAEEGVTFDKQKLFLINPTSTLYTTFDKDLVGKVQKTLSKDGKTAQSTTTKRKRDNEDNADVIGNKQKRKSSSSFSSSSSSSSSVSYTSGLEVRQACRNKTLVTNTSGMAPGYAQANLVILPKTFAFDFLLFCTRNPQSCPLLEVTSVGSPLLNTIADGADIRTDLPKYRVWKHGVVVDEPNDITSLWNDSFVAFLLGCSFSFEEALLKNDIPVRNIEEKKNVPMFRTNIENVKAGVFGGFLVVSMRPMTKKQAKKAFEVTSAFPRVHGHPIHMGDPLKIGISDISKPTYGDAVTIRPGEIPVFWACGVTPQEALIAAKVPLAITHSPGHMLVTDKMNEELKGFGQGIIVK
jgi:O-6-methylguanine DNA methyltransferase